MSKHSAKSDEDWGTDKEKPATKQAEKAMYDADEALMEHRTTSLLGILYKLEFIAHEEIKEDADDQVGRTINGLVRELRLELGRA